MEKSKNKNKISDLLKEISIRSAIKGTGASMPNFMFEPHLSISVEEEIKKIKEIKWYNIQS